MRRVTEDNKIRSYILWNLKDVSGNMVGNGVYIFKVEFFSLATGEVSSIPPETLKQGVARRNIVDPLVCEDAINP